MKAQRQPMADAMPSIRAGATSAPTLVPLVKMPFPSDRSRGSMVRATMRIAAGQLAASVMPSSRRNTMRLTNPEASPVAAETTDQSRTAAPNAHRRCSRSSKGPTAIWENMYA